eukprot:1158437-Pelagomonas_calceolata.AAC.3
MQPRTCMIRPAGIYGPVCIASVQIAAPYVRDPTSRNLWARGAEAHHAHPALEKVDHHAVAVLKQDTERGAETCHGAVCSSTHGFCSSIPATA